MKKYYLCLILLFSCSSPAEKKELHMDVFDQIASLKGKKTDELVKIYGEPQKVEDSYKNSNIKKIYYEKSNTHPPMHVFINKKTSDVISFTLNYWVDYDAYAYLKKRFKAYKWIETSIQSKAVDVEEDRYQVEIPDLGISFEYDNQDPLRRPMWILIK